MNDARETNIELIRVIQEINRRVERMKIKQYFPDTGDLRRELYPKHIEFFTAGSSYRQRLMLAANRIGKTESVGLYELVLHLTGDYPVWWPGRRFDKPIKSWVAGDTKQTVREILQDKLLGPVGAWGTGLLPADAIYKTTRAGGVADTVETVTVRSKHGGISTVTFKSYDQGRKAFQGTEQDVILLDEEPPLDVYSECLLRTMTNDGLMMLTFTPLLGMSDVVLAFMPEGTLDSVIDGKFVIMATWDDVPHLSAEAKAELMESIPPFQRDARSKGVPQLGAGAIYPVPESTYLITPFEIPEHWPRVYALDVGWNRTAALWAAIDRETSTRYLYSEYYVGQAEPVIHAQGIKSRGDWIQGVIDPAARGRGQKDGQQLMNNYIDLGLNLQTAKNAVEAGLYETWQQLSNGQLKVFNTLGNFLAEIRMYRRDEKGKIVKSNDHLMDSMRYLVNSGFDMANTKIKPSTEFVDMGNNGWMG